MSHACHGVWTCYKTLTFCSLLTRSTIPCACQAIAHLNLQKWREHVVLWTFWLRNVLRATTACTFSTSQLPKVVRACFAHVDLEMCFAPQHRALFRHRNFQKWSGAGVFCTLKVLRSWGVLYILTSKCASRHNGVQFFISHLARWLRTRRFSKPTFRPSGAGATNHWKNTVFRDLPTFSRTCIFFLLTLSLLWSSLFCSSLFYSSRLSYSSHLCFSSLHIVGSLTSKLPSIIKPI